MEDMYLDSRFWLDMNDRRNIWYFDYFAAKNILGFLRTVRNAIRLKYKRPQSISAGKIFFRLITL